MYRIRHQLDTQRSLCCLSQYQHEISQKLWKFQKPVYFHILCSLIFIQNYLSNIEWHGSGTDDVPNSVTTIRCACVFFFSVSVCMNLFWYVTVPFLIANLCSSAEQSNRCWNVISPTFQLPGPLRNRLPFSHVGIVPKKKKKLHQFANKIPSCQPLTLPWIGSITSSWQDRSHTSEAQLG